MDKRFFNIRREYSSSDVNHKDFHSDPMRQFNYWFKHAQTEEKYEPNAFALGTATKNGRSSTRYLLLKSYDQKGFIFFTNYESKKSQHLSENPFASMAFYWPIAERQIRIEGCVELLAAHSSDEYFNERPEGSKIGAWASPQSKPIPNRAYLEDLKRNYEEEYKLFRVPRPKFWGGYKLIPTTIEFWQGKKDRLHDRFEYQLKDGLWIKERLAP